MTVVNGWTKILPDTSFIDGSDYLVSRGLSSWRKTPCRLLGAILKHYPYELQIHGLGEYWQSDRYESIAGSTSRMVARRIARQIQPGDRLTIISTDTTKIATFSSEGLPLEAHRWFCLELDLITNNLISYILASL